MPLVVITLFVGRVVAGEQLTGTHERGIPTSPSRPSILGSRLPFDWTGFSISDLYSRTELPRSPRVSRSHRPLRQITLVGGDRFVGECLDWKNDVATFRLLDGRTIRVPIAAVAILANPPGEVDLLEESFEGDLSNKVDPTLVTMLDETQTVDGRRSLRMDSSSPGYRHSFSTPLASARIEFSFRINANDLSTGCGEWQLEWNDNETRRPPLVVHLGSDRRVVVTGAISDKETSLQTLTLSEGWHSFIALVSPERTRLIVDEAILAVFPTRDSLVQTIRIRPAKPGSKNILWIDGLQVRRLLQEDLRDRARDESIGSDVVSLDTGDALFCRLLEVTQNAVVVEAFAERQSLPWTRLTGLAWRQPSISVQQLTPPVTGIASMIEMQSFVDRPDCESERWTATIVRVNSELLIAQHALVGELVLKWTEIRRIDPLFFGQTILLDARRFHLGNSIRSDLHRHLPDGTELQSDIVLPTIPRGQPHLSLDVAELEAAGPNAPPASPFLAELRSGRLVTEVFVNDQRVGDLNSLIRFKANSQSPDRVRLAFPRGTLKMGNNIFRLSQKPLKPSGSEFDDCEIGNMRLEFE